MSFQTISAILRGKWLIDEQWVGSHLPLINGIIEGKVNLDAMKPAKGERAQPFMVLPDGKSIGFFEMKAGEWGSYADTSQINSKAKPGTVAVIPVIGPIMKYDGSCGEAGSVTRGEWFKMADADENVSAIIGYIDSPGGQVDGTASLADTIKGLKKPTIAIIDDGMMASAAMWIGSAFSEIYASQPTDSAGSIGVYTTLMDVSGWYEKQGVKLHTVYAPESSEKNIEYRNAMQGKYDMIKDDLSVIAQAFHETIKTNRGDKLTSDKWNKGGMYYADEATEIGLIDGIKSFEAVVTRARELADITVNGSGSSNQVNNQNTDMKFPKLEALRNASEVTPEVVASLNTELAEAEIEGVQLVSDAEQIALVEKAEKVEGLEASISEKDQEIATLKAENAKLSGENTELKEKVNKPAAEATTPVAEDDKIQGTGGEPAYHMTSVDKEKAELQASWGK